MSTKLEHLRPTKKERVIDLVSAAGIPTDGWSFTKNGGKFSGDPSMNPNFCYEWSFRNDQEKIALLNIWHEGLIEQDGKIKTSLNIRKVGDESDNGPRKRRAANMDSLARIAAINNWTVKTIIMDGREVKDGTEKASTRMLDSSEWFVESYDSDSGTFTLVRGIGNHAFVDQFDLLDEATKKQVKSSVYERSEAVRREVLERASGRCEYCNAEGFITTAGGKYVESHHIISLSEGGADDVSNVIALCPYHHRYAHYSENAVQFRLELTKILQAKIEPK